MRHVFRSGMHQMVRSRHRLRIQNHTSRTCVIIHPTQTERKISMKTRKKQEEKKRKQAESRKYIKKKRNRYSPEKQIIQYRMIDGNLTYYPYGYCFYHKGWLTIRMAKCHKCKQKNCKRFMPVAEFFEMQNNTIEGEN